MNFRRILLTGAALGSAAALTTACSNSDDVVLTIPTTDSAVTGNDAGQRGNEAHGGEDDGRFIARCSTEADGDGFAGQTFFTDGSSDFSDYCLQRFYSGVQPAPGAIYVPREDRENPSRESEQPTEGGSDGQSGVESRPQQVPTDGQVLAEGQSNRNQNITEGDGGQQAQNEQGRSDVGAEQGRQDNFGAANAGSPNSPGDGNNTDGNNTGGNEQGGNNNPGNNAGGENNAEGGTGTQPTSPTTPTTPGQDGADDGEDNTTTPELPDVPLPSLPSTPETTQQQPSTQETTGGQQGQTTTQPSQTPTGQQGQTQTQTPSQPQSPQGTGSTEQQTPTQEPATGGQGTIEDTSAPSGNNLGGFGGSEIPEFPQFPPLQVPSVDEVLGGLSS